MGWSFPVLILWLCCVPYVLTLIVLHKTRGRSGRGWSRSCPTPSMGLSALELGLAMGLRVLGEVLNLLAGWKIMMVRGAKLLGRGR